MDDALVYGILPFGVSLQVTGPALELYQNIHDPVEHRMVLDVVEFHSGEIDRKLVADGACQADDLGVLRLGALDLRRPGQPQHPGGRQIGEKALEGTELRGGQAFQERLALEVQDRYDVLPGSGGIC
jgi:hypothetical protein